MSLLGKTTIISLMLALMVIPLQVGMATAGSYAHDALGRLISATYDDGYSITYTYDGAGNILKRGTCLKGEVTNDGTVNVLDAIAAVRILLGLDQTPAEICHVDMDNNSLINVLDVVMILRASL